MYPRKNVRLDFKNYVGPIAIFVTLCCHNRRPYFANADLCNFTLEILRETAATRDFAVHAYCFMPDHLHVLVEGLSPSSDFLNCIKTFKLRSSRKFIQLNGTPLWQEKFVDHILRQTESFESVCLYIWSNPIRANLANELGTYRFAGSFTRQIPKAYPSQLLWTPADRKRVLL